MFQPVKSVVSEYDTASGAASAGKLRFAASWFAVSFGVGEPEGLVPDDGPAGASAEDLASGLRVFLAGLFQEVVRRVEIVILVVVERRGRRTGSRRSS